MFAEEGVIVPMTDLFGKAGQELLDAAELADAYATRVESLRDLLEVFDREIAMVERKIAQALDGHQGYAAIQAIPGVGPILAAVFVAEIGDITRFPHASALGVMVGAHASPPRVRHQGSPRGRSPRRAPNWCAGRRSKPWPHSEARRRSELTGATSPNGEE